MSVRDTVGHTVLASADSEMFTSLRKRPTSRTERYAMGRALRRRVPRKSLGTWSPPAGRPDPVQLLLESHEGRLDWLIPVRVARMVTSPYGFLRGTAIVMAADVSRLPATGILPVICGDSHLGNFGFYASPEGELVIDLNDFDEAHPGQLGVGSAPAGRQHLGGRAGERVDRGAVPRLGAGLRRGVPGRGAFPGRTAATDAQLQPARRRAAARDGYREVAARRDRAVGQAGPDPDQRSRAAAVHRRAGGSAAHRRGTATDHPAGPARVRRRRRGTGRVPGHPGPALATGGRRLHAGRHRPQGRRGRQRGAARVRGPARGQHTRRRGLPATQAGAPLGAGASTCTATRPGTRTRGSASWSTSRRCRR